MKDQEKLYLFNNSRMHPANQFLNSFVRATPLVFLDFPPGLCAGAVVTISIVSYLAHANLDVSSRVLSLIFNTPEVHRIHHNRNPQVAKNFGSFLAVWDHIFGTYNKPGIPHDVGLPPGEEGTKSLIWQFLRP